MSTTSTKESNPQLLTALLIVLGIDNIMQCLEKPVIEQEMISAIATALTEYYKNPADVEKATEQAAVLFTSCRSLIFLEIRNLSKTILSKYTDMEVG